MFRFKFEVVFGDQKVGSMVKQYWRQKQQKQNAVQYETEEFERIKSLVLNHLKPRVDFIRGTGVPVSLDTASTEVWICHNDAKALRIEFIGLHRKITFVKEVGPIPFNQSIDIQAPANMHRFGGTVDGPIDDEGIKKLVDRAIAAAIDVQPGF